MLYYSPYPSHYHSFPRTASCTVTSPTSQVIPHEIVASLCDTQPHCLMAILHSRQLHWHSYFLKQKSPTYSPACLACRRPSVDGRAGRLWGCVVIKTCLFESKTKTRCLKKPKLDKTRFKKHWAKAKTQRRATKYHNHHLEKTHSEQSTIYYIV